ncbi:hypothetical protein GOP47_0027010 [Adiantum capillus-veneris]|nr:hypothetical protein GOP47_0026589 [Adiantum capillus-veneris]KAI5058840.1 hypothetical protein GOP47_0027010 [Adiantum capillus-veneris]
MDQHDDAIKQFRAITASTPEQARFFLESSGWQVEVALQNFYEGDARGGEDYEDAEDEEEAAPAHPPTSPFVPAPVPPPAVGVPVQGVGPFPSNVGGATDRVKDKKPANSRGSIRTLSDFNRRSDSDSEEDTQEYYTGGEKSGMMVQDPQKGNRVDAIFEQARRMGAQQGPSEPPQARANSRTTFTGMGRTLAGEPAEQGGQQAGGGAGQRTTLPQQPPDPVIRNITFWRNGFTVDDGPLRRLEDPANAEFLTSIGKSECPKELEPNDRRTPVHVNLMRREDDWTPPPEPRHVAFQGFGRTLGSSSSTDTGSMPISHGASNQASQGLCVDDTKPVTSIQLRLSDGTRMIARFNHHHTVADIRRFIDAARPGHAAGYQLQTMGFPPKILNDLSQSIEAAGLSNAVVIQKA